VSRKFFGTLYNCYSMFALYANIDKFDIGASQVPYSLRPEFDKWIISRLNTLIKGVEAAYEDYDVTLAGRLIQDFVGDDLSNWYIRLNKKRLWGSGLASDKLAAYQTLYEVLKDVALLAAPIAPFYMENLWLDLVPDTDSVHYRPMPKSDASLIDTALEERMALAQQASSMVLALRKKAGINVRKPLARLLIPVINDTVKDNLEQVKGIILTEVNVKEMQFIQDTTGIITKRIKPNFKTLGKVYGKQMKEIAAAFGELSQQTITDIQAAETAAQPYTLSLPSGDVILNPGDYTVSSEDMPGWLVASEGPLTIALDIEITPELRAEGTARELVNRIQNIRKDSGFDVTDKVDVRIYADGEDLAQIREALASFGQYLASQTLALSVEAAPLAGAPADAVEVEWNDGTIRIKVTKDMNKNTDKIMAEQKMKVEETVEKTRYSDEELAEFKEIILDMLAKAKAEYTTLRATVMRTSSNDIEDTSPSFKTVEDDGANQLSKEEASQLAARQYKFIQNLEAALARIENKTYGICRVTGKLIPKERLRLVPHATLTVEAKEMLAKNGRR
jgi:isoleucyl-tRNA synthetase